MTYYKDGKSLEYPHPFAGVYVRDHAAEGEIFRVTKAYEDTHLVFAFFAIGMVVTTVHPHDELSFSHRRVGKLDAALVSRIRQHAGDTYDDFITRTNRTEKLTSAQEYVVNALANGGELIESRYGATLWRDGKSPRSVSCDTLRILREKNLI